MQSIGIEALLKRYNNQLVKHRELKVENEILVKKDRLQSNEVRSLKQERLAAEARVASLQENLNELNALQVHANKIEKKLHETENELAESKKLASKLEVNAEKWKSRAFEMSQQMLEQYHPGSCIARWFHRLTGSNVKEESTSKQAKHSGDMTSNVMDTLAMQRCGTHDIAKRLQGIPPHPLYQVFHYCFNERA